MLKVAVRANRIPTKFQFLTSQNMKHYRVRLLPKNNIRLSEETSYKHFLPYIRTDISNYVDTHSCSNFVHQVSPKRISRPLTLLLNFTHVIIDISQESREIYSTVLFARQSFPDCIKVYILRRDRRYEIGEFPTAIQQGSFSSFVNNSTLYDVAGWKANDGENDSFPV